MGQIVSIVYTPDRSDYVRPEDRYARTPTDSAELIVGKGINGDRKGSKYPARQINLMAEQTVKELATEGFKTAPGELGEQIVVSGVDIDNLNPGDRVRLGSSAILEVDKARTGCDRFERVQGLSKSRTAGRLGQMLRVIAGGMIRVGDEVQIETLR
jgi:MOSC domain-containing protein YiiM